MKDETYSKSTLTRDDFGEMLDICIGDLSHAIRHRDDYALEKVKKSFERLLSEQLPKVPRVTPTTNANTFEALFEKYKPHLQALDINNPADLIQWCLNRGWLKVEELLKTIDAACRASAQ